MLFTLFFVFEVKKNSNKKKLVADEIADEKNREYFVMYERKNRIFHFFIFCSTGADCVTRIAKRAQVRWRITARRVKPDFSNYLINVTTPALPVTTAIVNDENAFVALQIASLVRVTLRAKPAFKIMF